MAFPACETHKGVNFQALSPDGGTCGPSVSGTARRLWGLHVLVGLGLALMAANATAQSFPSEIDLAALATGDSSTGFVLNGVRKNDFSGFVVSAIGDINNDGIGDLAIGALKANRFRLPKPSGVVYVVFGRIGGYPSEFELSSLLTGDGSKGFVLFGEVEAGEAVNSGDFNGDGIDDLMVASRELGRLYVLYGRDGAANPFPVRFDLPSLLSGDGSLGFVFEGASTISGNMGDINGDGIDDFAAGQLGEYANTYVVFGRSAATGGFPALVRSESIFRGDGSEGFVVFPDFEFEALGQAIDFADVSGDGIDDVIISAEEAWRGRYDFVGSSMVIFGRDASTGSFPPWVTRGTVGDDSARLQGFEIWGSGSNAYSGKVLA